LLNQSDALFGLPVALSALLEVLLDAALAVHPYLGHLRGREEEGQQHRAIPVPAGKVDGHDDEPSNPTGGVQGAPPVGSPGDGGGQRHCDGQPQSEGGGGSGGLDRHRGGRGGAAAILDGLGNFRWL
jgi:hypothetical protein